MSTFETKINTFFASKNNSFQFDAYTSISAKIELENRAKVEIQKLVFPQIKQGFKLIEPARSTFESTVTHYSISLDEVVKIGKALDSAYMTTDYRKVFLNATWKQLFNVQNRDFGYIRGVTLVTASEESLPCRKCGILLPSSHMTIDHKKPQSGGEDQAILKVLRGLHENLTALPGHGKFATAYREGTTTALPVSVDEAEQPSNAFEKERRYTLTHRGGTVLAVLIAATDKQTVLNACMHSVFNLRPYCAKCNISKSNVITDLDWIN